MNIRNRLQRATLALAALALSSAAAFAQAPVEVPFFYPVAVGGPITRIIDGYVADFEKENPGIKLKAIYSGSYQESIAKALTAVKSGEPPVTSILLSTDMYTLIDEDAIVPFDDLIKSADDQAWLKSFYAAFMENSQTGGKTWGIPFQRSTVVLYYNKDAFKEAGLDPNKPPTNWREQVEIAQKLTKRDASGNVTQWGVQIPSSGFPYWLFQGLAIEAGANLMNPAGTQTFYDKPEVIEALQYWVDLVKKHKVHPEGIVDWGTTPKDFFEKKVAMVWTTTGNLTNVKNNAKFDFGVAMLPAGKQRGSPTGGGNFYIFKKSTPAQRDAAFKFIKWVTTPARTAT
jgi:sn-glycerol 3-phosphate transport system substrate-binding protein